MTESNRQSELARPRSIQHAPSTWLGLFRHITAGGLAGIVAGLLVAGVGGRLFMRAAGAASGSRGSGRITEAGFTVGEVTVGGTIALVLFIGVFSGIVGAVMFLAIKPWVDWTGRWRGAVFGGLLFGLTSATSDLMNPDNVDFFILGNGVLLVSMILGLFVVFGLVTDASYRWLDARIPGDELGWRSIGVVYATLTVVGAAIGLSFGGIVLIGGGGTCGCEPPVLASWSFIVVALSTVIVWVGAIIRLPATAITIAHFTGYSGTIGILIFGLTRAFTDAAAIIN